MASLWLPIALAPVAVFIVSSVIHMATPWHKKDYAKAPDEGKLLDALRPLGLTPGDYVVPHCESMDELKSPEFAARMNAGPVLVMTVRPNGMPNMGKTLGQWFLSAVVVTLLAAHVAAISLSAGAYPWLVFHVVWETAFAGYALALWPLAIWYGRSWGSTLRGTVDGLLYALITGGIFVWAWPRA
ncbi:MAG: hypothetical protein H7Y28_15845 [Rhodoferax sp.]|nr:hypothetical protein [Rhodoferax sp.]